MRFGRRAIPCDGMPRTARIVIPGLSYHVTQRGNNGQDVFLQEEDRRAYLRLLAKYARRFRLEVRGWCLMTNHLHLIVMPWSDTSLARALGVISQLHAQRMNTLHGRKGHLWQDRFYSCAMDESHAVAAMRYVEQNPVRAKLTNLAWTYAWSSAAAHVGGDDPWGLLDLDTWRKDWSAKDWRRMLKAGLDDVSVQAIRRTTSRGRPQGSEDFVSKVESLLGRRVRPLPVGRQRGWRKGGHASRNK